MKRAFHYGVAIACAITAAVGITSCNKDSSATSGTDTASGTSSSSVITVAVTDTSGNKVTDSIYMIHNCGMEFHRDTVSASNLPAAVTTYLTTNYAGYTFVEAFSVVNNRTAAIKGYVAIIVFNNKPVGLLFDASGNFIGVLEQRERGDLTGIGWHVGGRFRDRDISLRDTVSLSALPAAITGYFSTNYAQDTLLKAFKDVRDGYYLVISSNNGLYANLFNASGNFVSRIQIPVTHHGRWQPAEQSALPASITTYLTTTYPGYVFKKAFTYSVGGSIQEYVVVIDASGTRYAVLFDASGNFVKARTLR